MRDIKGRSTRHKLIFFSRTINKSYFTLEKHVVAMYTNCTGTVSRILVVQQPCEHDHSSPCSRRDENRRDAYMSAHYELKQMEVFE